MKTAIVTRPGPFQSVSHRRQEVLLLRLPQAVQEKTESREPHQHDPLREQRQRTHMLTDRTSQIKTSMPSLGGPNFEERLVVNLSSWNIFTHLRLKGITQSCYHLLKINWNYGALSKWPSKPSKLLAFRLRLSANYSLHFQSGQ